MNKEKRIADPGPVCGTENPHPTTTELNFYLPFELLIAVLLSAQATGMSVNKATALLYPVANTPAMLELGVEGVKSHIKPSACLTAKPRTSLRPAGSCWNSTGRSTGRSRRAGSPTGAQDCERGAQHRVWLADHRRDTHIFRVSNRD